MKKLNKKINFLIGIFIFSNLIGFNFKYQELSKNQIKIDNLKEAQLEFLDGSLNVPLNFSLLEESEGIGQQKDISNVDINLGTSRWNITDIELNITDMYFKNETKIIEDQPEDKYVINKQTGFDSLGVQIQINIPTSIYGIYIYGENRTTSGTIKEIFLQIQGSNKITGNPNGTILKSIPLNMSKSNGLGWHMNMFDTPINISSGFYYLVLNGTDIGNTPQIFYDWWYCDLNPYYPDLNISLFSSSWGNGISGSPLLYKIIQNGYKNLNATDINMTATINGIDYPIQNGPEISTGKLNVCFKNYFLNSPILQIPFKINVSNTLIFDVYYHISLNHSLKSKSNLIIKKDLDNSWLIEPTLNRFGINYSVKFFYQNTWSNLKVYKSDVLLTINEDYSDNGNFIEIFNKTIPTNTVDWQITANSTCFNLSLDFKGNNYTVGQNFGIQVKSPARLGNYTFILEDQIGEDVFTDFKKRIDTNYFFFNYTFPSYSRNGGWTAYVFWNNNTDAGVSTASFQVSGGNSPVIVPSDGEGESEKNNSKTSNEGITPIIFTVIIASIIIGFSGTISLYTIGKQVKKRKELQKERIYNEFMDIFNLSYIMISHRKSGLNVFEKNFAGANMNPTLISGYLSALNMFSVEIAGNYEQSHLTKLEFQNLFILMNDFKDLRLIVIFKENPSKSLLNTITQLSYEINNEYGDKIATFQGEKYQFDKIGDLIEKHLKISLISPLKVKKTDLSHLNQIEAAIIQNAKHIVKKNNFHYIFASFLIPGQYFDYNYAKAIIDLIEKGILIPLKSENIK